MSSPNRRLNAVCEAYGVGQLPRRRVRAGTNNEHWFVGDRLVLRRYARRRPMTMIDYEHSVLSHLHEAGWPVAAPLPAWDGRTVVVDDDRCYTLFPRLPGRVGAAGRRRDPRALGQLLACLHSDLEPIAQQITTPPLPRPDDPPGAPPVWPPAFRIGFDPIWEGLGALPDAALGAALRAAIDRLGEEIAAVDTDTVPSGIVHGEWGHGQILYRGGKVTGVLDFDFTHPDLLAVDLGIATSGADIRDSAEMIVGYRAERGLSAAELTVVGLAQRAVRLGYMWPSLDAVLHGNISAVDSIRLQLDQHDNAERNWATLLAAIA